MTKYQQGRRYEYKVMKALVEEGYTCIRAASSKGLWDVVGVNAAEVRLIQVKSTRQQGKTWRDANCKKLEALEVPPGTRKEIWVYRVGIGTPEIYDLGVS